MVLWLLACAPSPRTDARETGGPPVETGDAEATVEDFTLVVDPSVVTMIHATWTDPGASESWVEYRFETADWRVAPTTGTGAATLLGIPPETAVEARAVAMVDGETRHSAIADATTGVLPPNLLVPAIDSYDPSIADEAPYVMISVAAGNYTFSPPYWIEIFDRAGRIVWYVQTPNNLFTFYPTVGLDGTHIWWDASNVFGMAIVDPYVTRQTLDGRWSGRLDVPDLSQAISEGPDGRFFYARHVGEAYELDVLEPDGSTSTVWDCGAWARDHGEDPSICYMNTCNWSERHGTVLASLVLADTVFEVDVATGEPIRQMGQLSIGEPYAFSPTESTFEFQHDPMWLDNGNLLVSTHQPGWSGIQIAAEYSVDDATHTLTRAWSYTSTDVWATQMGEALRLPNGNTVQGYGQDGVLREVTPDGDIAFQASWEKDSQGYRVVGHASFLPDLYALNVGP